MLHIPHIAPNSRSPPSRFHRTSCSASRNRQPNLRASVYPTALQVKKPPARTLLLMKAVAAVMAVVALLAIVGSAQNIIVSWSSYTFFS